jgi:hypothetical protein
MHRATRLLLASLTVAACLWPLAVSAQAQDAPPGDPALMVDQLRGAFISAGYQVDPTRNWDWTSPPVTSFRVHDPARGRVVMVLVYRSATAAQVGRLQAEACEQALNAMHQPGSPGPHLVLGYGPSVWNANVAMVQTSQTQLERLSQVQDDRDNGVYVEAELVHDTWFPPFAVDLDFQQALNNGTVDV